MSQTLCLFCCRHFKCENHFSWHHCLWLHKTQRRPSSGLYQTDCEQTKLPKMIYLLVFRRWMEPKYIRPDCQLRPKKVYFSIRHNAVNGSLRTFEPSQNNLIHWPNSIHNPFAYANREAPTEHIKSRMSNKQTTTTTHTHNRKTIPELHCILTARRRICTRQTSCFTKYNSDSYSLDWLIQSFHWLSPPDSGYSRHCRRNKCFRWHHFNLVPRLSPEVGEPLWTERN